MKLPPPPISFLKINQFILNDTGRCSKCCLLQNCFISTLISIHLLKTTLRLILTYHVTTVLLDRYDYRLCRLDDVDHRRDWRELLLPRRIASNKQPVPSTKLLIAIVVQNTFR